MGLKMGDLSISEASIVEDDFLTWLKELALVKPYLKEAPCEDLCGDYMMVSTTPNIRHRDSICISNLT